MKNISESIYDMIDNCYDRSENIKKAFGKVIRKFRYKDEHGYWKNLQGKYEVKILSRKTTMIITTDKALFLGSMVLPNRTGEPLDEGDEVLIYYWKNITDGYIAIKLGLSRYPTNYYLNTAVVKLENTSRIELISDNITELNPVNRTMKTWGYDFPDLIYVNKYPAIYYSGLYELPNKIEINTSTTLVDEFKSFVLSHKNLSQSNIDITFSLSDILTKEGRNNIITDLSENNHFGVNIYRINADGTSWYYNTAIYQDNQLYTADTTTPHYNDSYASLNKVKLLLVYDAVFSRPCTVGSGATMIKCPYGCVRGVLVAVDIQNNLIYSEIKHRVNYSYYYQYFAFGSKSEMLYAVNVLTRKSEKPY